MSEYKPFSAEWELEMLKFKKQDLVEMLRASLKKNEENDSIPVELSIKPACGLCKDCKHFEYSQDYNNVGDCRHPKFSEGIMFQHCDDIYVSEDFGCINYESNSV